MIDNEENSNLNEDISSDVDENILSAAQKFRQLNIVREIEDIGQSYLLLNVFERIKNIVDEHNQNIKKCQLYFLLHKIFNQVINEIDDEISKIKPRYFRKVVKEMLFFKELNFDKYIHDRNHVIRLFIIPAAIINFLLILTSLISNSIQITYIYYIGIITLFNLFWLAGHAAINYFSKNERWDLTWNYLWQILLFSFLALSIVMYSWANSSYNISWNTFLILFEFIIILIFSIVNVSKFGSFDIKILSVFEDLKVNLKEINKKVITKTLEKIDSIIELQYKYDMRKFECELVKKIHINSIRIAGSVLDIECEKRAKYTDSENRTVNDVNAKKTKISSFLEKHADNYTEHKSLSDLLWEFIKDVKSVEHLNEEQHTLVEDYARQLSSLNESFRMDGNNPLDKIGLGQILEWVLKLLEVIMPNQVFNFTNSPNNGNLNAGGKVREQTYTENNYLQDLTEIKEYLQSVKQNNPSASDEQYVEIIDVEFEDIKTNNPDKWNRWMNCLKILFQGGVETAKAINPWVGIPIEMLRKAYEIHLEKKRLSA
jgi:hypothetical protein